MDGDEPPRTVTDMTAVDLYSGAGGATQGLTDAGFKVLAAIEFEPHAAATYGLNHPRVKVRMRDIRRVRARRLRQQLHLERGDLGLLQACPPCPSWSSLGAKSTLDPREGTRR